MLVQLNTICDELAKYVCWQDGVIQFLSTQNTTISFEDEYVTTNINSFIKDSLDWKEYKECIRTKWGTCFYEIDHEL